MSKLGWCCWVVGLVMVLSYLWALWDTVEAFGYAARI